MTIMIDFSPPSGLEVILEEPEEEEEAEYAMLREQEELLKHPPFRSTILDSFESILDDSEGIGSASSSRDDSSTNQSGSESPGPTPIGQGKAMMSCGKNKGNFY